MSAEFTLRAGGYLAVVTARAAALRVLQFGGRDLVVPFPAGGPIPDFRGIVASPWPNRIADGTYSFDGVEYRLPLNEADRACALHGLVFPLDWETVSRTESSVVLACEPEPVDGYPHRLRIEAGYSLTQDGLHCTVSATNLGGTAAPYGVCPHPYLVAGPAPLDEWILEIPADSFLDVSADRLLPVGTRPVAGHAFDFRSARAIGATRIDHAFTDIAFDDGGRAGVLVRDPGGTGVGMSWDRSCRWLQIHTADKLPPAADRLGLAVEPMSCPPDAFNSGTDLVRLEAGATHRAAWTIFAV
ncbi:galactose mutarotase [Arthrobacter sp. SW1]|uniref:aldose 1-epimerase family protein n=1 Tax=Arthrobacter sp. SW1 TaxID=1920889 RepID=UPI000877C2DB|nr:aldose 1-epimerase family protein [Arthrobacter sp. SW1]OFI37319.1 galactose mutarotase [Arthrobacter sp. SW1]